MYLFHLFFRSLSYVPCIFALTYYFESKPFDKQNTLFDKQIRNEHISEETSLSSSIEIQNFPSILSLFGSNKCLLTLDNYFSVNLPNLEYPLISRKLVPSIQLLRWDGMEEEPQQRIAWYPGMVPRFHVQCQIC